MKQSIKRFFYGYDKEQFLFPLALWVLFILMSAVFFDTQQAVNAAGAFLGYVIPLLSGVLAAYSLLTDGMLELRFSTAQSAWHMLAERILLLFGFIALLAISFQGVTMLAEIDLSHFGSFSQRQLVWAVPGLFAMGLGSISSFLARNAITGAGVVGGLWIIEILMRNWFTTEPILQYIFLFQGMMRTPGNTELIRNQVSLTILSILFFIASGLLLQRQERYLK